MSAENVTVVQAGFEAWGRGDVEAMLELIDPGIEWVVRPDLPDAGVYRGHEEILRLFARFEEVLEDRWIEAQEFIVAGDDCVIVPVHWGGRGKLSGAEVSERHGETWIFRFERGKVTRVTEFRHKAEALEAAGMSE